MGFEWRNLPRSGSVRMRIVPVEVLLCDRRKHGRVSDEAFVSRAVACLFESFMFCVT
jgi:hypothetical protein